MPTSWHGGCFQGTPRASRSVSASAPRGEVEPRVRQSVISRVLCEGCETARALARGIVPSRRLPATRGRLPGATYHLVSDHRRCGSFWQDAAFVAIAQLEGKRRHAARLPWGRFRPVIPGALINQASFWTFARGVIPLRSSGHWLLSYPGVCRYGRGELDSGIGPESRVFR